MANNQQLAVDNFGSVAVGWSAVFGLAKSSIVAAKAQPGATAATLFGQLWSGLTWPKDHTAEVTVANLVNEANTQISLLVRYQAGASSGYLAQWMNGSVRILRADAGVFTNLTSLVAAVVSPGDVLTFNAAGTSLTVYQNGKALAYFNDGTYTSGAPGFLQSAVSAVTASQVSAWRGYNCVQQDGIWQKQGIIIPATTPNVGINGAQNLWVIREDGAKILSGTVFKAWVALGADVAYMESLDGISWTSYASNPVIVGVGQTPCVIKVGATYHLYGYATLSTSNPTHHYTSTDGINWVHQSANVFTVVGHAVAFFYPVAIINGTWYAHYVFVDAPLAFPLPTRLATSTDGVNWADYPGNPVTTNFWGFVPINVNGIWYAWGSSTNPNQQEATKPGVDPYETIRMQSTDLIHWTNPVHSTHHSQMFEGLNLPNAGSYGFSLFNVNGSTYMFLQSVSSDDYIAQGTGTYQISLAIAPAPIAAIVQFAEDAVSPVAVDNFAGVGDLSSNWVIPVGATKLQLAGGNLVQPSVISTRCLMAYINGTFGKTQYAEITIAALVDSGAQVNPCVYVQTGSNSCYLATSGGLTGTMNSFASIYKIVSGAATQIGPFVNCTPKVGDVFRLVVTPGQDGFNVLSYYQNGYLLMQVQDYSNALTSGFPGISAFDGTAIANARASAWAGGNAGIIPTYPILASGGDANVLPLPRPPFSWQSAEGRAYAERFNKNFMAKRDRDGRIRKILGMN